MSRILTIIFKIALCNIFLSFPIALAQSPDTLLYENFEDNVLDSKMTIQTIGTFNSTPSIKNITNLGSAKAFGFGLSTCAASCFDNFVTSLIITLPQAKYVSTISFKEMELFGNWGSWGEIYLDGVPSGKTFGREPFNDRRADTNYRQWNFPIELSARIIEFRVRDITNSSEIFIDDFLLLSGTEKEANFSYWVPYVDTQHFGINATYNYVSMSAFDDSTFVQVDGQSFYLNEGQSQGISPPQLKEGLHIVADKPLQIGYFFGIAHYGLYEDGSLSYFILEEGYLGTDYWIPVPNTEVSILATQNNTSISVNNTTYNLNAGKTKRLPSVREGTQITSDKPIMVVAVNYTSDHYGSTYAYEVYPTNSLGRSYFVPHQHPYSHRSATDSSKTYILAPWDSTLVIIGSDTFQLNRGEFRAIFSPSEMILESSKPVYAVFISDINALDPWGNVFRHYQYAIPLLSANLGIREAWVGAYGSSAPHGFPGIEICITSLEDNNPITLSTGGIEKKSQSLNKGARVYLHETEVEGWTTLPLHIDAKKLIQVTLTVRGWWNGIAETCYGGTVLGKRPFQHDVGVVAILTPTGEINSNLTISPSAIVKNYGLNAESFTATFQIGNNYVDTRTFTLESGTSDTLIFSNWVANELGTFITACSTYVVNDERLVNNGKSGVVIVSSGTGPLIQSISPNHGGNTGTVTVEISGSGFQSGATIKLTKAGQTDIIADSSATEVISSSLITTSLDLRNRALGKWNVGVTNPDNKATLFFNGFTVETEVENLWVDIVGQNQIRVGQPSNYLVTYGNSGNIDIDHPYLIVGLPKTVSYEINVPWALPDPTQPPDPSEDAIKVTFIDLPALKVGETEYINFGVTPNQGGSVRIYSRITTDLTPYFQSLLSLPDSINLSYNLGKRYEKNEFQQDFPQIDFSLQPPAGYVMMWDNHGGSEGFHIAKSLGEGNMIDMLNKGTNPDLSIRSIEQPEIDSGYRGALRPPNYSIQHGDEVKKRAQALSKRFEKDDQSRWVTPMCSDNLEDDVLVTNCIGAFHILNPEFRSMGLYLPDQIYNKLAFPQKWDKFPETPRKFTGVINQFSQILCGLIAISDLAKGVWKDITALQSIDPNDKAGPTGFGELGYLIPDEVMYYVIHFENVDTATAPALKITIIDSLDNDLDWSTLKFADTKHTITSQEFDPATGIIIWKFEDINLPPNKNPPEGEGWVSFQIKSRKALASGTQIKNKASITFDFNEPVITGDVLNTIDAFPPISNVLPLVAEQPLSTFEVHWSGVDDGPGSGVRNYAIYVSDNGGPYTVWRTTDATSGIFTGQNGHTYRFYSIARDNVGNVEVSSTVPDAITTVKLLEGVAVSPNPFVPTRGHTAISFFGTDVSFSKIKVFNKAGELVKTLEETEGREVLEWNTTNDDGKNLASGVYIWVSTNQAGKQVKGKFAIIR